MQPDVSGNNYKPMGSSAEMQLFTMESCCLCAVCELLVVHEKQNYSS